MVIRKTKMFDWFNTKKIEEDTLKHFKPQWMPQEEPEMTYLAIGPTSKGRVSIKLNYGVVTLDEVGIDSLIQTLEASKAWLDPRLESGKQPEDGCQEEEQPV